MEMGPIDLAGRRKVIAWLACGIGVGGFFLLLPARGPALTLQYSTALFILTMLCFRWWTDPVHPGFFGYLSPHAIVLFHSLTYFGLGPLPRLAFPEAKMIGRYNIGADEYYLPMLIVCLAGLLVFDLVYRKVSRSLSLNQILETGINRFHLPGMQAFFSLSALFWYFLCLGVFIHMTRSYVMQTFLFQGVQGSLDNIFFQGGYWLVGTAWVMMSLHLFKPAQRISRTVILALLALLLPVMFAYQNRRLIVYCLVMTILVYFIYPRRAFRLKIVIWGILLIFGAFILMTSVKYITLADPSLRRYVTEEKNIFPKYLKEEWSQEEISSNSPSWEEK